MAVGVLDDGFHFRGDQNKLLGEPGPESQFEGIAYVPENDTFLLLHESYPGSSKSNNNPKNFEFFKPFITTAKQAAMRFFLNAPSISSLSTKIKGLRPFFIYTLSKGNPTHWVCAKVTTVLVGQREKTLVMVVLLYLN